MSSVESDNAELERKLIRNHTSNMEVVNYLLVSYESQKRQLIETNWTLADRNEKLAYCKGALDRSESEYFHCILPSLKMNGSIYGSQSLLQPFQGVHPSLSKILVTGDDYLCPDLWNYKNSFFFAATVVSTIGYGNVYPITTGGKVFTMIYAIIGIPFFGILLARIADYLMNKVNVVEFKIFGKQRRTKYRVIVLVGYISIGSTLFLFIPALCFTYIEGWTFMDSLYFTIISLTTIGIGDFAPSFITQKGFLSIYRVMALGWLLIGLAWLGGLMSLASSLMSQVHHSFLIGPIRLRNYERNNIHSNQKMVSVKHAKRDVRTREQKLRDREDEIMKKNGKRKVQYMNNINV